MSDEEYAHRYDAALANDIEARWQARWAEARTFAQPNPGEEGFDATRPKYYCLDMFPYPSGAGLHVGHAEGYTATDIISRFKRMRGFNVLHPMGWDAFGLPAEQYAIQTGIHPAQTTQKAIDNFRRQLQGFGFSYDWTREFGTIDPDYYRWTQWIFLQIYKAWFDPDAQKARPLAELEDEFARGKRPVRFNPDAAEVATAERDRELGAWDALDDQTRRQVLDSWRLTYVGEQVVNWCPKLGTALANEEVIDGRSERGGHPVLRRPLRQWMFRITAFGDRLAAGLRDLDWPEATKTKQRQWIGRSEGAVVEFALSAPVGASNKLPVYTTRPDTLFGATYMVVAPEHPLVDALLATPAAETDADALGTYVERARNRSDLERQQDKEKTGVFSGVYADNPVNGARVPVWVADYVLMGYGHGAIMAVPAHDARDHEFAEAFGLPVVEVVQPPATWGGEGCFAGVGTAVNSSSDSLSLDGLATAEAKEAIVGWLEDRELGHRKVNYKLRDWLFSRQRYWGEPFPIVFDADGNHHGVDESALPVALPELVDYAPEESGEPKALLAKAGDWLTTTAGAAGVAALPADAPVTREANTMPGWAGSCWYFLRYADNRNGEALIGEDADSYWLGDGGVDLYIGGAEHAVLHLLYARFWHQALHDLGHVRSPEPFRKLFHQGLITSFAYQRPDKSLVPIDEVDPVDPVDGAGREGEPSFVERATGEAVQQAVAKMSKSLKNVVNPDEVIERYGADTFRLYEMYMGPLETSKPWNMKDIGGLHRFLQRAWRMVVDEATGTLRMRDAGDPTTEKLLHRTLAKVEEDIERLAFNTAIAAMIKLVNHATSAGGLSSGQASAFVRMLAPFAPHVAEELWQRLGQQGCVSTAAWPEHDPAMLVDDSVQLPVSIKGKVRARIEVAANLDKAALEKAAMADPQVQALIAGQTIRKVIVVPGKMINIVTG